MSQVAEAERKVSDTRVVSGIAEWIVEDDLVRQGNFFNHMMGYAEATPEYLPLIAKGIEKGLRKAFKKDMEAAFHKGDWFSNRYQMIIAAMCQKHELVAALTPDLFEKIVKHQLEGFRNKLNEEALSILVNTNPENMAILARVVKERIKERSTDPNVVLSPAEIDQGVPIPPEREAKERRYQSVRMIGMFYNFSEVLKVIDVEDVKVAVKEDLVPCERHHKIFPGDILTVAKALKSAPQFEETITPENITVVAQTLHDEGKHKEAAALFKNIQHVGTFREAFLPEYTDVFRIGENISIAFNTVSAPDREESEIEIMVGSQKFDSFEALVEKYQDDEITMRGSWMLNRLAKEETLPEFVDKVRHESPANDLAKIVQKQIGMQPIAV